MFDLLRFVRLETAARRGDHKRFFERYRRSVFGGRYRLLADILHARMILKSGKSGEAVVEFKRLYSLVTKFKYYNVDTRKYLANYVYYYTHIAHGVEGFFMSASERPLDIEKVNAYVRSAFYHPVAYWGQL